MALAAIKMARIAWALLTKGSTYRAPCACGSGVSGLAIRAMRLRRVRSLELQGGDNPT